MSKTLNEVTLIGRLGSDPDVKYLSDGIPVANFSVATNQPKKEDDKWVDGPPEWTRCCVFRKLAEIAGKYLHKGSNVYVKGRLKTRSWNDKDGNKRYTTEVRVRDLIFLDPKKDLNSSEITNKSETQRQNSTEDQRQDFADDDYPFDGM